MIQAAIVVWSACSGFFAYFSSVQKLTSISSLAVMAELNLFPPFAVSTSRTKLYIHKWKMLFHKIVQRMAMGWFISSVQTVICVHRDISEMLLALRSTRL
uniref:Uncharacterized protein n=1 Tax=Arundo donax TaxID=35708 RepID=A0A0A9CV74_ARUDO